MVNYKDGKIYTIRCRDDDTLIYVGSTTQPLYKRLWQHKSISKTTQSFFYQKVNGDWDNYFIELYEEYPCENKEQLLKREGEVIRQIGTLNKYVAGRTKISYREDNKEKIKQNAKEYRDRNVEKLKVYRDENQDYFNSYQKKYREENKDILQKKKNEYNKNNKEKIKKWFVDNADKNKLYMKQYYQRKKAEKAKQQ